MSRTLPFTVTCCFTSILALAQASAADVTIAAGTTGTTAVTVAPGETLKVETGAVLTTSGGTQTVVLTGTSGSVTVDNYGAISQTGANRAIRNNTNGVFVILHNFASGSITSLGDDVMKIGQPNSGYRIENLGRIHQTGTGTGSGQGLDLRDVLNSTGNTIVNGSPENTSATIRADGDDALRPGANTTILNYGTIISNGVVNTKCPDYLGAACSGKPSAHDAIDIGGRTGVSIENFGTISGPRHGVTADSNVYVVNRSGGLIVGRNGSGVGSDGAGTVINYGAIRGEYAGAGNAYEHIGSGGVTTANNGDGDGVDIDGVAYIENYGSITGAGAGGVDSGASPNGSDAIAAGGGSILNAAGASIRGQTNGILVDNGSGGSGVAVMTVSNAGSIEGVSGYGVRIRGAFDNTIVNSGLVSGGIASVETGTGADTLDMRRGGRVVGAIDLGGGADRLLIESGSYRLSFVQTGGLSVNAPGVIRIGPDSVVVVDRSALPQTTAFAMTAAALDLTAWRADLRSGTRGLADPPEWQAWARGFAHASRGGADGSRPSWTNRMAGAAAGVDTVLDASLMLGAYVAAGGSNLDSEPQETDSTNVFGGVYGRWAPGTAFLDFGLSFGSSRDKGSRVVFDNMAAGGIETARSVRSGFFVSPILGVGLRIEQDGFVLAPAVRVRYMAHDLEGYRESATNGMHIGDNTLGLFEVKAELAIARRFDAGFTLRTKIGALYDTQVAGARNPASVADVRLSLPMDVRGLGAGAFGSVGVSYDAGPSANFFAEIEGVAKTHRQTGYGGRAGLLVRF